MSRNYSQFLYFNPLPPYGGRLQYDFPLLCINCISIHSLRMEGDSDMIPWTCPFPEFQSTPSVWRETVQLANTIVQVTIFQSTPSVWRETHTAYRFRISSVFQSTPSVWRETSQWQSISLSQAHFNPLPPYGGRPSLMHQENALLPFQSTPSVWRETESGLKQATESALISIYSLRMEGD